MAIHDSDTLRKSGQRLQNVTIVFFVLAWFFIGLRTWTRSYIIANFGWDDSVMILSGVVFTAYCACLFYIEANGGGTHVTDLKQLNNLTKRAVASESAYVATIFVMKISVGIFFIRIVVKRWQRILIYTTLVVAGISSAGSFFYVLFRCGPDMDQYVLRQLNDKCTPRNLDRFFAFQHASFAFLTDCIFVLLPIAILWNSNMSRRSKLSVGFILSLAASGCVCSAIRFRYVDGLTQIDDFFWNATNISIWSTIEAGAGIMSGCMATLSPLVKQLSSQFRALRSLPSRYLVGSHSQSHSGASSGGTIYSDPKASIGLEVQSHKIQRPRKSHRASTEYHHHRQVSPPRFSQSAGRGSEDVILSRDETIELFKPSTRASQQEDHRYEIVYQTV